MSHAILLAGGLATRLYPLTKSSPKCLILCEGRAFIDYELAWMANNGIDRVTFVLGHLSEMVVAHLKSLSIAGLKIDWVIEGDERLGTGGAVTLAVNAAVTDQDFFVVYGDSFMPIDFYAIAGKARSTSSPATMTVMRNQGLFDASNCHFRDGKVPLYSKNPEIQQAEKFEYIDYGATFWNTEFFKSSAPDRKVWDLAEAIGQVSQSGRLFGFEIFERFYEIGSPSGLADFRKFLLDSQSQTSSRKLHQFLSESLRFI